MDKSHEDRRHQVMVGNLPEDFLRLESGQPTSQQVIQHQQPSVHPTFLTGNLKITIVEAELVKNYGLTKMDPYARVRIGHNLYETHADLRGGKHPLWNKTFNTYLPQGIRTIFLEVFDEQALIADVRIAWASLPLPEDLLRGKYLDTWVDLSGKQGETKEGKIHIICNFSPAAVQPSSGVTYPSAPIMVVPTPFCSGLPYYSSCAPVAVTYQMNPDLANRAHLAQQQQIANNSQLPVTEDLKQLHEMFPSFDEEVIKSVFQSCGHNKDQAINTLLTMSG